MAGRPAVFSIILHLVGFILSGALVTYGGLIFATPKVDSVAHTSFWLGQGMLFIGAGLMGFVLECFHKKRPKTPSGWGTPLTIVFLYFWMGFSALGGVRARLTRSLEQQYPWLDNVDLAFAACAFTAAVGNLFLPCFHTWDDDEYFDVEKPLKKDASRDSKGSRYGSQ